MAACNRALGNHAAPKYLPRRVVQKKSLLCLVVIGEFPRSCTSPGPAAEEDSPILWRKCFLLCRICLAFKYAANISLSDLYPTPLLQSSGPHQVLPCRNVRRKFDARSKTVSFFPSLPPFFPDKVDGREGERPSPPPLFL